MNSHIGKTCPYCQYPIKQNSEAVYCNSCNIPHHRDCWEENKGCTTFGCKETIIKDPVRERVNVLIENPANNRPAAPSGSINPFLIAALVISVIIIILLSLRPTALPGNQASSSPNKQEEQQATSQTTQQTSAETSVEVKEVVYYVITESGSNLFIRKSPGRDNKSNSDIITKVPRGTQFHLIDNHANTVRKDGFTWWEIKVVRSGKTGWVAAEYISTNSKDVRK